MGLLSFAKSVGARILGTAESAATPPDPLKRDTETHSSDPSKVEARPEASSEAPASSAAVTAEAEKTAPVSEAPAHVAATQGETGSAGDAAEPKLYTVQPGDSLWKIAEAEYGHGHGGKYHLIFEANKSVLFDPDEIHPGQVLRIPPLVD